MASIVVWLQHSGYLLAGPNLLTITCGKNDNLFIYLHFFVLFLLFRKLMKVWVVQSS